MSTPELFQFQFSHYNEKARWALDYKRVQHVRHSYIPGPHTIRIQRLSGQTMVPVLRDDGTVIPGSARIIDHLESSRPDPPLYPRDEDARERALKIQQWFDDEVGPQIRCALFHQVFPDRALATYMFTYGKGPLKSALFRAAFPLMQPVFRKLMAIDDETAAAGRKRTREAFDFVVAKAGPAGYLIGDSFTVADLAAAALLMPAVFPAQLHVKLPQPVPERFRSWIDEWKTHPGTQWVAEIYRRHRGTSAEVAG